MGLYLDFEQKDHWSHCSSPLGCSQRECVRGFPFFSIVAQSILHFSVQVKISGGPATAEVKSVPKHKKNAEIGDKKTVYTSNILIEQEDAVSFDDQEEVNINAWYICNP